MALSRWQNALLAAVLASASSASWGQAYLGLGLGAGFYNDAEEYFLEDESTAYEFKGGVRLADVLGLEFSYLDLGEFRDQITNSDISYSGTTISGKAILPLGPEMEIFAKIGMYFWELDEQYRGRTYVRDEGEDLMVGGGVAFYVTDELSVDLEYRLLEVGFEGYDMEVDLFSAGISYRFW